LNPRQAENVQDEGGTAQIKAARRQADFSSDAIARINDLASDQSSYSRKRRMAKNSRRRIAKSHGCLRKAQNTARFFAKLLSYHIYL
jgi:hypothetical protein